MLPRLSRYSMRHRQRNMAAMVMVSSSDEHMSVMRISRVGNRALGRTSHHSLVASSSNPALTRTATVRS